MDKTKVNLSLDDTEQKVVSSASKKDDVATTETTSEPIATATEDIDVDDITNSDESTSEPNATTTEDIDEDDITISDKSSPIVLLFGPMSSGKSMTLVRLSRYLRDKGFIIKTDKNFKSDSKYKEKCDEFMANLDTKSALPGTPYKDCRKTNNEGFVKLVAGAQTKEVSFADLYNAKKMGGSTDAYIEHFTKDYYIKPRSKYESVDAGFSVDLDIPKGNADSDKAIREWMMAAIRDDAFYQLQNNMGIPVGKCTSLKDMQHSLDDYGVLWEKLCRAEYQIEDTLELRMTCDIKVKKVADCDDYTTYYYWASLYGGGLHDLPREYYITYDKQRGGLLDVNNSVKPAMVQQFRHLALESLKKEYDFCYERENSWEDFTHSIFSFHCPMIDTSGMDDVMRSLLVHNYSCDDWAGWNGYNEKAFTEKDFPLTHFAVLPEGIVLTYHPYQIDCFAAGEYHAVIPFKEANKCLMFDYSKHEDLKPKLQRFIKW